MVKIIKEKDFDGRCFICGCYFEYTYEDLEKEYIEDSSYPNGKRELYKYVKCPKCGVHVLNIWHNGSVKK